MYAEVNGINLYYETHGSRRPLILLHGGGCTYFCTPRSTPTSADLSIENYGWPCARDKPKCLVMRMSDRGTAHEVGPYFGIPGPVTPRDRKWTTSDVHPLRSGSP
jgi:hypothetical protein